jgi:hypothetical protein
MKKPAKRQQPPSASRYTAITLSIFAFLAFYVTTNAVHQHFDYTFRVAGSFLQGRLGLAETPPSWLNEMIPSDGRFYSVFPLGAVLVNVPLGLLQQIGLIHEFPGHLLAAAIAAACVFFFFELSTVASISMSRRALFALFPIFGTWAWCNLGFGGAWQIALGFAVLGETAALYFTLVQPAPLLAGASFALAFGNRTELLLTFPFFVHFLLPRSTAFSLKTLIRRVSDNWRTLAVFAAIPLLLGIATAAYNFARFGSVFDFGYSRIPNLLNEPWYRHGLFSPKAIPWNLYKMLLEGFTDIPEFPYIRPHAFGCSIFLASPFLCLLFREGGRYRTVAWTVIALLTGTLWCHGNPGGWQFSYRYAMVLLPWMFLLLLENGPAKISLTEMALFTISLAINGIATYQFLWTDQIHP